MYEFGNFRLSGKTIVYIVLFYTIIMETLISQFGLPDFIRYLNDFLILLLIPLIIKSNAWEFFKKNGNGIVVKCIVLYLLISLFTSFINFVSPLLVIWALRNTFRGIIFFLACAIYIKKEDIRKLFNVLLIVQVINLILALYQFAILHHEQDAIGGIFGYGNGAAVNIYNALIVAYFLVYYIRKESGLIKLIFAAGSALIIAAVAEEKATYFFTLIVVITAIFFTRFTFRKLIAIVIVVGALVLGLVLLGVYYPSMLKNVIDINSIFNYATITYDDGYRLPRLGSFSVITDLFFENDIIAQLFGIGFGNSETSGFSFLQSDFYSQYGDYNYRWFTHQWIFIEEGYAGFIAFLLIFISMLICLFKNKKKDINNGLAVIAICTVLCCIVSIWYNATLKVDMQYLAYFAMSIGFIENKNKIRHTAKSKILNGRERVYAARAC